MKDNRGSFGEERPKDMGARFQETLDRANCHHRDVLFWADDAARLADEVERIKEAEGEVPLAARLILAKSFVVLSAMVAHYEDAAAEIRQALNRILASEGLLPYPQGRITREVATAKGIDILQGPNRN